MIEDPELGSYDDFSGIDELRESTGKNHVFYMFDRRSTLTKSMNTAVEEVMSHLTANTLFSLSEIGAATFENSVRVPRKAERYIQRAVDTAYVLQMRWNNLRHSYTVLRNRTDV